MGTTNLEQADPSPSLGANAVPARPAEDTTRAAGRGGLAIAFAKVSFILFGFAQQLILPRLLGVSGYGQVSLVLGIVSVINNVVVAVSIQGVSRAVSSAPENRADEALRATLRVHVVLAMFASGGLALAAGSIAAFEGAPHVTAPLRLVAAVVLFYGIYAPLVGALNGRRRFLTQAGLDVTFGALRMVLLVGGAVLFTRAGENGVLGAFAGFVVAAAMIVPIAMSRTGLGRPPMVSAEPLAETRPRRYLAFLVPLAGGQVFLNLLMQTDSLLLRRFAGLSAASAEAADALQGVYRGAQLFSFLPYQLLMSVTFILFPMLARAKADNDPRAVRDYTATGVRLALILTVIMSSAISATAPHLLRVVFPKEIWQSGGPALRVLALGMGSFSILGILCAALTSLGKARTAAVLTLGAAILVATGCFVLVPRAAVGPEMLVASATATSVALTAAAGSGAVLLSRAAGGFASALTLVRVLVALLVSVGLGSRLPWIGPAGTVAEVTLVGALGLLVLVALGEVGRADLARILQVAGRRK